MTHHTAIRLSVGAVELSTTGEINADAVTALKAGYPAKPKTTGRCIADEACLRELRTMHQAVLQYGTPRRPPPLWERRNIETPRIIQTWLQSVGSPAQQRRDDARVLPMQVWQRRDRCPL